MHNIEIVAATLAARLIAPGTNPQTVAQTYFACFDALNDEAKKRMTK